jgi:transposase-like protein
LRLRLEEREPVRAFWRSHFEVWAVSGLTQQDYCERHGLNLKSFGNWRAQLKREDAVGPQARWGRYPRLRSSDKPLASHMANPMVKKTRIMASPLAAATERRRNFSEDAKRRIVAEANRPGSSLSAVARRYHIDLRLLFRWRQALDMEPVAAQGGSFVPVRIAEPSVACEASDEAITGLVAPVPSIIVERPTAGIEIELVGGRRVRFDRDVDAKTMKRFVAALEAGEP